MAVNIKYTEWGWDQEEEVTQDLTVWLLNNLSRPPIEQKISRCVELIAVMMRDHLERNPHDAIEVAEIIECDGRCHQVVKSTIDGPHNGAGSGILK